MLQEAVDIGADVGAIVQGLLGASIAPDMPLMGAGLDSLGLSLISLG